MKLVVACVGSLKKGAQSTLCDHYRAQLPWKCDLHEIQVNSKLPSDKRRAQEAEKLRHAIRSTQKAVCIALDSKGKHVTSEQFAAIIAFAQNERAAQCAFLIGGQDGLDPSLISAADHVIAFGAVTWPHQLLRVMLFEQIYRAHTIISGHPYHTGH
jgi:23S rRNA (pseudouridine1915-N3)-methyltransferase